MAKEKKTEKEKKPADLNEKELNEEIDKILEKNFKDYKSQEDLDSFIEKTFNEKTLMLLQHMLNIVDHYKIILDQTLRYLHKANVLRSKNLFHTAILAKREIITSVAAAATSCQYPHSIPPNLHSHKKQREKPLAGSFPLSAF